MFGLYNVFIKLSSDHIQPVLGAVALQFVAAFLGSALLYHLYRSGTDASCNSPGRLVGRGRRRGHRLDGNSGVHRLFPGRPGGGRKPTHYRRFVDRHHRHRRRRAAGSPKFHPNPCRNLDHHRRGVAGSGRGARGGVNHTGPSYAPLPCLTLATPSSGIPATSTGLGHPNAAEIKHSCHVRHNPLPLSMNDDAVWFPRPGPWCSGVIPSVKNSNTKSRFPKKQERHQSIALQVWRRASSKLHSRNNNDS